MIPPGILWPLFDRGIRFSITALHTGVWTLVRHPFNTVFSPPYLMSFRCSIAAYDIVLYCSMIECFQENKSSNSLLGSCLPTDYWIVDPQSHLIILGCVLDIAYYWSNPILFGL